jgi:hypothetical protein
MNKVNKLFKLLILMPVALLVIVAWTAADESIAQLRLDHAALRAAEDDYRALRDAGLDGMEAAEYAGYIARLQRRVFEGCRALLESGPELPADLPCPLYMPQMSQSAEISTRQEQTPQEQVAALDNMLNAGLGEFDEKLLREQERIRSAAPNDNDRGGSGSGNGAGDGGMAGGGWAGGDGAGESAGDSAGEGGNPGGRAGGNPRAGDPGERRSGGSRDSSPGGDDKGNDIDVPEDIPDASDDDVVARQLREAAEKETDPELKAKLWEEYRRYKRGTT